MKIIDENGLPKLEEILGFIESEAYNAHYDIDMTKRPNIVFVPNGSGTYPAEIMPTIYCDFQKDDKYFWFNPRMVFPEEIKDVQYLGGFSSRMRAWTEAARLADSMLEAQWELDAEYDDD